MTDTEETRVVDGVTFRKEKPTATTRPVDAKFYVFTHSSLDGVFVREFVNDQVRLVSMLRPGWGPGSQHWTDLPIAPDVGHWKMRYYTFPPEAIAPHLSDFAIDEARADWYPDISATHLGLIVTEEVRAVIEGLDPGSSYFFPMQIRIIETGDPLPGTRYYWKPRREMVFTAWTGRPGVNPVLTNKFPPGSSFSNDQTAWEFANNQPLREFLGQLPFWTMGPRHFGFAMSPTAFRTLKAELFTGLLEMTADGYDSPDFDFSCNVGYF